MARRNTRRGQRDQATRELANRDVLQITSTDIPHRPTHVEVRRLHGHDPVMGRPQWTAPFHVARRYLADHGSLAYATTAHAAEGRTTGTSHVIADGLGNRQSLYVSMSRGRDANYAYCVTIGAGQADVRAGSSPAPELARFRHLARETQGRAARQAAAPDKSGPALDPVSVLAGILARTGGQLTATDTLEQALSHADHLGVLGAIWDDLTRRHQHRRFGQALRDALPADLAEDALSDPACTWLWRTLREAEAAGQDGGDALRRAIARTSLIGANHVARVLDSRLRHMLDGIQPQPPGPWAARVPDLGDPEMNRYLRELADAMDDRARRLGEHTAQTQPSWTQHGLGPVPDEPACRADWEQRASLVAIYRERYGYADPDDPIGPAPGKTSPEARAIWHAALSALAHVDGLDLRACSDGELWLHRDAYERETAWAPAYVAEELRLMRIAERDAHVNAVRASYEARSATDEAGAARHRQLTRTWLALEAKAAREAGMFAAAQTVRQRWAQATETIRRIALAADAELRRRHPAKRIEALRPHSAETQQLEMPARSEPCDSWVQLTLDGSDAGKAAEDSDDRREEAHGDDGERLRLFGLTPETANEEIPAEVYRILENAKLVQLQLDELTHTQSASPQDHAPRSPRWPATAGRRRTAVVQPPQPEITPPPWAADNEHLKRGNTDAQPERG